jgi:hypothetical protein
LKTTRSAKGEKKFHHVYFAFPPTVHTLFVATLFRDKREENQKTEVRFHYTHAVVTVTGTNLRYIHDTVVRYELYALRELPRPDSAKSDEPTVSRIEITEKAEE